MSGTVPESHARAVVAPPIAVLVGAVLCVAPDLRTDRHLAAQLP
jgi:hypothetical protein